MCKNVAMTPPAQTDAEAAEAEERRFGAAVRRFREEAGWSQGELARRLNELGWTAFHQTTVSRIEKGERPIRLSESKGLQKVFGRNEWEFYGDPETVQIEHDLKTLMALYVKFKQTTKDYANELTSFAARARGIDAKLSDTQRFFVQQLRRATPLEAAREALAEECISGDEIAEDLQARALGREPGEQQPHADPPEVDREWLRAIWDFDAAPGVLDEHEDG